MLMLKLIIRCSNFLITTELNKKRLLKLRMNSHLHKTNKHKNLDTGIINKIMMTYLLMEKRKSKSTHSNQSKTFNRIRILIYSNNSSSMMVLVISNKKKSNFIKTSNYNSKLLPLNMLSISNSLHLKIRFYIKIHQKHKHNINPPKSLSTLPNKTKITNSTKKTPVFKILQICLINSTISRRPMESLLHTTKSGKMK